jgi:hypothetical protein
MHLEMDIDMMTTDNFGTKRWYNNDWQLHRFNGPAVESSGG